MSLDILFPNGQLLAVQVFINDPIQGRIEWDGQISTGPITIGAVTIDGQPIGVTVSNTTAIPVTFVPSTLPQEVLVVNTTSIPVTFTPSTLPTTVIFSTTSTYPVLITNTTGIPVLFSTTGMSSEAKQDLQLAQIATFIQLNNTIPNPPDSVQLGGANANGGTHRHVGASNADPGANDVGLFVRNITGMATPGAAAPLLQHVISGRDPVSNAVRQVEVKTSNPVSNEGGVIVRPIFDTTIPLPVTGTFSPTALVVGPTALGALNDTVSINLTSYKSAGGFIGVSTLVGTLIFEVSADGGLTWFSQFVYSNGGQGQVFTLANPVSSQYFAYLLTAGYTNARVKVFAYTSGSVSVSLRASTSDDSFANPSIGLNNLVLPRWSVLVGGADGTVLRPFVMKASGTAALITDPSVVVAISPNSPLPGSLSDGSAFTEQISSVSPNGFVVDDVEGTPLTENEIAAARITLSRAQVMRLEGSTRGIYQSLTGTAADINIVPGTIIGTLEDKPSAYSVLDRLLKIEQAIKNSIKQQDVSSKQIVAALANKPQNSPALTAFRNMGLR